MIPSNFRIEILSIRALLYAIGSKGLKFSQKRKQLLVSIELPKNFDFEQKKNGKEIHMSAASMSQ